MSDNDHAGHETPYESYRQKAKDAFGSAKFEKALKLYTKAIKKHRPKVDQNNLEEVYVNRAVCYLGLFKYEEAIIEADLAIKCNPEFSKAYYRKAEAKGKLKCFAEAQALFDKCLSLSSDEETQDLVLLKKQVLRIEEHDERSGIYFRYLVPGVDYCESSSLNPITKLIYEIGAQMRNIIYMIGDRKTGECLVVDPCWDVDGIMRAARKDGMRIIGAIQTHNHFDHVGGKPPPPFDGYHITVPGVKKLLEKLDGSAKVYVHQLDADVFQSETEVDPDRISTTEDGQVIQIGQVEIKCIHTPGHTPGSQCLQVNTKRVLTGDTLFVGSCGRTDLPGGCENHLYDSLRNRIGALPEDTLLFPAHLYGKTVMTTVALEKKHGFLNLNRTEFLEKFTPKSS